jgi:hypothetical protein
MSDRIVPIPGRDGKIVDGVEIPVEKANEQWSEYTLADGSIIRIRTAVMQVVRIPGDWDPEGNPLYSLKAAPNMIVISAPEALKKPK